MVRKLGCAGVRVLESGGPDSTAVSSLLQEKYRAQMDRWLTDVCLRNCVPHVIFGRVGAGMAAQRSARGSQRELCNCVAASTPAVGGGALERWSHHVLEVDKRCCVMKTCSDKGGPHNSAPG